MKNLLPVLGFIVLIGLYAGFSAMYEQNAEQRQQEKAAAEEAAKPQEISIEKKFEDFLNGFLKDVVAKAEEYRKERLIVDDLVKPQNVAVPTYIMENSRVLKQTVVSLNDRMNTIMNLFGQADGQVDTLLQGQPEEKRVKILETWRKVKKQQGDMYMAFFASEQDILQAYTELMDFYSQKMQAMQYDPAAQIMAFTDENDRRQETALRKKIDDLRAQQAVLLGDQSSQQQ